MIRSVWNESKPWIVCGHFVIICCLFFFFPGPEIMSKMAGESESNLRKGNLELHYAFLFERYCIAGNFRQRKILAKATVRQFVRNLFSSNAGRSFAMSVIRSSLFCLSFIFAFMEYFWSQTCGLWKKLVRNLILSQKLLWWKRRN